MERHLYTELLAWKKSSSRKPLILKGARQVGKTWLLKQFGSNEFRKIHLLNFEENRDLRSFFENNLDPMEIVRSIQLYFSTHINLKEDLLIFDEIQECENALTSLKYFSEKLPELAVCCAGSNLGINLNSASFPVGKVDSLVLYPMNFKEFILAAEPQYIEILQELNSIPDAFHNKLWELTKVYYAIGGLPEIVQRFINLKEDLTPETFEEIRYLQNQLLLGYRGDFAKHAGKVNANHISRVFENIPEQIAKENDSSVQKYRFKGVIPGLSKYSQLVGPIEWLIYAGLFLPSYLVETVQIPLKAYKKENRFKLFFFDIGLLNAMLNLSLTSIIQQDFSNYKGYLAENFVAQELRSYNNRALYSWRGKTSEIEFLLEKENKIIPLEVKSGKNLRRSKSLDAYRTKNNPDFSIIASANSYKKAGTTIKLPLYLLHHVSMNLMTL
jgi:predicted AAA+ superfamily ATPase